MSAPLFFLTGAELARERVVLTGPEGRHAATVRRLGPGERVDLSDGAGCYAECVVVAAGRDRLELDVGSRRRVPPPEPRLVVVQALPKGDRAELAVEALTEVGADVIVPWAASRCVTRWSGERAAKGLARWRATARAAAKQARRPWLTEVGDLATTGDVVALLRTATQAVVLHEEASAALSGLRVPATGTVAVVVGPEGGIAPEELAAFDAAGAAAYRLGPTVLRTSTAGAAASAVLLAGTPRWS